MSNPNNWLDHEAFQSHSFKTLMEELNEKVTVPSEIVQIWNGHSGTWHCVTRPKDEQQEKQKRAYRKNQESKSAGDTPPSDPANPDPAVPLEVPTAEG